jgi:hypothetical protein
MSRNSKNGLVCTLSRVPLYSPHTNLHVAQVEGFLKHATESTTRKSSDAAADNNSASEPGSPSVSPVFGQGSPKRPFPHFLYNPRRPQQPLFAPDEELPGNELLGLGRFESLPPFEMIEEL